MTYGAKLLNADWLRQRAFFLITRALLGRFPFNKKFQNEISGIPCDEWNSIFRLFRFSGILGQPREVHPKFRNETPENVCSIRSPTRNIRNFWSNGKRPRLFLFSGILGQAREVHLKFQNDIPENVLSIRSSPGISGIFGRMESALGNGCY